MIVEEHPTAAQLTAFGLGKLDDAEFTAIEAHVAECETCRHHLETQAADSFVALARAVRSDHTSADAGARPAAPFAPTCALTDSATPASTDVPHELADHPRYRILGLIGVGGMGAVFKAEHLLMHRVVALKVINRRLVANPAMVERFTREVIAAGNLSHPNIVHYHDAEHIGDTHFLVMEHVEGTNLAKLMAEIGPLPIGQACDFARQAALGLQHAFERGMVHRDIKPQNLMVSGEGRVARGEKDSSLVKILDFGLARLAQETAPTPVEPVAETIADEGKDTPSGTLTQIGTVMGTPDYIAPEQARDAHAADIRSDIYSLGCTVYDLLAGKPPFPTGTVMQKVIAHLEQTPRPLKELRADVPAELARVVEKMLAKDPAQRYQTPAEVAAALAPFTFEPEAFVKDRSSLASASDSGRRRHWGWAAAGVAVCVVIASLFLPPVQDYAQTMIRIATNKGVLEIEADDEDLEITIRQTGKEPRVEMVDRKTRKTFELTAVGGNLVFREKGGDLRLTSTKFELSRGDRKFFRARMLLAEVKTDREIIQGTWKPVRVEIKGMPVPDLVFQTLDPRITIKGTQIVWKLGPNTLLPNIEGEIMLDPSKSPKTINMIVFDKANQERKVLLGIYKLEGDTLEICSVLNPDQPADRPKEFKSDAKGFVGHIVLQRAKSGADRREPAFQPLFNGKDLTGWKLNERKWTVKDGAIIADCAGELVSDRAMSKNFRLRMEIKLRRGTGVVRFRVPAVGERDWNVALMDNRLGMMDGMVHTGREIGQKSTGLVKSIADMDEWMVLEITAQDQEATVRINGKQVMYLHNAKYTPAPGHIGLRIVATAGPEDTELQVRKIEIMELPPGPLPPEPGFQALFHGKDLTGWSTSTPQAWTVSDGVLAGRDGVLRSDASFENFEMRAEIRLKFPGTADFCFRSNQGEWGYAPLGNQWLSECTGALAYRPRSGKSKVLVDYKSAVVSGDEWFILEVRVVNKQATVRVNGAITAEKDIPDLAARGRVEWHVDPKSKLEVRKVEVKELRPASSGSDFQPLFNGKDLDGWDGDKAIWKFQDGELIGTPPLGGVTYNTFLVSKKRYKDFELKFQVQLKDGAGNSGVQIRSETIPGDPPFRMRGPQADIADGYWGSLWGEHVPEPSGHMLKRAPPELVNKVLKPNDFNNYYVKCVGKRVTIKVNGLTTVDEEFTTISDDGLLGWQMHFGKMAPKVVFRDIQIRELPTR